MRMAAFLVGILVAGCSKSTCGKAVDKMLECKIVVGDLLPGKGSEVFLDDAKGRLTGACDVAVDNDGEDKRRMECAASASTCEALVACQ